MSTITTLADPTTIALLTAIIILHCISRKEWYKAVISTIVMGGGMSLVYILKELIQRPRPDLSTALVHAEGWSLPSGHATAAILFVVLIIYLYVGHIKNQYIKVAITVLLIILVILSGYSRVYLGVHWVSDIIAGYILGTVWSLAVIYTASRYRKQYR